MAFSVSLFRCAPQGDRIVLDTEQSHHHKALGGLRTHKSRPQSKKGSNRWTCAYVHRPPVGRAGERHAASHRAHATAARIDGVAPAARRDHRPRPVNTTRCERLLGDAVSGIERTEAPLRRQDPQHETTVCPAGDDTWRMTQGAKKVCGVILQTAPQLCLSTTIAILFTVTVLFSCAPPAGRQFEDATRE